MATTSLWRVHSTINKVVVYVENREKTTESVPLTSDNPLDEVVGYVERDSATNRQTFVWGIHCNPDTAAKDMMAVKKQFQKTGGVIAYHGYQSFAPGEVTPEQAHEIGKQLARELWGDRYQILVTTHLDKESHIHNHFVINTVSFVDGKKYHRTKEDYQKMQEVSDRLCREHGLSVIDNPSGKGMHYSEWQDSVKGKFTVRGGIRNAMETAIATSVSEKQFIQRMSEMGYSIDLNRMHPRIKPPGNDRFFRFSSLGEGYSWEEICERIKRKDEVFRLPEEEQEDPRRIFEGCEGPVSTMGYNSLFHCYVFALEITMKRPGRNREMYYLLRAEHRQYESYKAQARVLAMNCINTLEDLEAVKEQKSERLARLKKERNTYRNQLKAAERSGDTNLIRQLRFKIDNATRMIRDLREEIDACGKIKARSEGVRDTLEIIETGKFKGKENLKDEHISRSGRSDSPDDTERH